MNKSMTRIIILLGGTLTFAAGLWVYSTMDTLGPFEYGLAGLVLLVVIFALIIGFKHVQDEKAGLPIEDELSISIKEKAAAQAFLYSFYLWTYIVIFLAGTSVMPQMIIGIGIMGMAILFLGFRFHYSRKGISNDNAN